MTAQEVSPDGAGEPSVEVQAPPELAASIAALLPALAAKGVHRLEVFSCNRPGEPPYWLAFIFDGERRHTVGTPDLRHMPLADQISDLLRQLEEWRPRSQPEPF